MKTKLSDWVLVLSCFILVSSTFVLSVQCEDIPDIWYNDNYGARYHFSINHDYIDDDLINYPLLLKLNASYVSECAVDFCFVDDTNRFTYEYEIDVWNTTESLLWVNITKVSSSFDTYFWLYCDALTDVFDNNASAVWDDNFVMVQHMNDNTTGDILDSTSYNNDGTKKGVNEPILSSYGAVGYSQDFDGVDDYVLVPDDGSLSNDDLSVSCWVKSRKLDAPQTVIWKPFGTQWTGDYFIHFLSNNDGDARTRNITTHNLIEVSNTNDLSVIHLVLTYDSLLNDSSFYIDTVIHKLVPVLTGAILQSGYPLTIGSRNRMASGFSAFFNGSIDEVRVSNTARSPAWINASYNNVVNYDSFIGFVTEGKSEIALALGNFNLSSTMFIFSLWCFLFYLWHRSESEGMTYLLAMMLVPYTVIASIFIVPEYFAVNIYLGYITFSSIALIIAVYTLDMKYEFRRK